MISNHNNFRYFITTKKLFVKQVRWAKKLIVFNFIIKYRKKTFNFANASSRKFNIIKSKNAKSVNNDFLLILRNKFRNQFYQSKLLKNFKVLLTVKLTISTTRLNNKFIVNIQIIDLNKKMFVKRYDVLKIATFRFLIHQIIKLKKFYLKLRESIIA